MTILLHLILLGSAIVYIVGNYLDYKNSLGREELNPHYMDGKGNFDPGKFRRSKLKEFGIILGSVLLAELVLSRLSPHYAYISVIAIVPFLIFGLQGYRLSKK